jgi:hypothetical protein
MSVEINADTSRPKRYTVVVRFFGFGFWLLASLAPAFGQSIAIPWSGLGHDPQHSTISKIDSQALGQIRWQMPVDLHPQYSGSDLLIHYGSPLVTRQNTVLVPVKTGTSDGFRVEARDASDGSVKWMQDSDYTLPLHSWVPSFGIALTPKNRVYFPGAGGTVYFRDTPDAATGTTGQLAFYGLANYQADPSTFNSYVKINTPITSDRYGNIYFGFVVTGTTSPALQSGIARISEDGTGSWVSAAMAANDSSIVKVPHNCAPALSTNQKTLYAAVSSGSYGSGYLVALDSRTLAPVSRVRLMDVLHSTRDAMVPDEGSASPTVGPDGDVYYGVLENLTYTNNHYRGWLLHFDKTLSQVKTPGAFGWDDTASIVSASLVSSYHGSSSYLVLTKYNNYVQAGGDGVNKMAVLDPDDTMTDPISGATVMKEILTVVGPNPDPEYVDQYPNAVREWCINSAAVDPATKSAVVNSEDGNVYRWDFTTNTLQQALTLTSGIGEAYTPTIIGMDGTDYAISNATLFAIGTAGP